MQFPGTSKQIFFLYIVDISCMQVCLAFNPQSTLVATGSMDATAKLWDVQSGELVFTLMVGCFSLSCIKYFWSRLAKLNEVSIKLLRYTSVLICLKNNIIEAF